MWCVIVLLTFIAFSPLEGLNSIEGTEKNQAILFTSGFFTNGIIGKVQSSGSNSINCGKKGFIKIDNEGVLTLVRRLPRVPLDFQCTVNGKTTVFIRVLQSCIGDNFAHSIIDILNAEVRPDSESNLHNSVTNHGMTPEDLLRILRQIPDGDPTKDRSMVALKIEKCVERTKQEIVDDYRKSKSLSTDTVVHTLFNVRKLFSPQKLLHLTVLLQNVKPPPVTSCEGRTRYRTFNGECNNVNLFRARFGAADTEFLRRLPAKYFDVNGLNDPIGFPNQPNAPAVPSPFEISREFIKIEQATNDEPDLTHAVMQIGQFLDHDIDLTDNNEGGAQFCEESDACSQEDPLLAFQAPCFPILANGDDACINFVRSAATFKGYRYPRTRQQINLITSYVDGSQIYGSSQERANELRDLSNDKGLLRVSSGNLLPETTDQAGDVPCLPINTQCFLAGDVRSNEQISLNSFHTLFVREHNRIATELKKINNDWEGEKIYNETRKLLGGVFQKIVYDDYLPLIIGPGALPAYRRYNPRVNPSISNSFATAAYRFGHSAIRTDFDLLDTNFDHEDPPSINLRFMFFNNTIIRNKGIESILLGLVGNNSALVDRKLASGVVENLFERPESGAPALNLAALNIQRSRDHGLPGYNEFRKFCGLTDAKTFEDTAAEIQNAENRRILRDLYNDDPNLAELWVAGLAETALPGASVGKTLSCIIALQFRKTRDGDRFFFENKGIFEPNQLRQIKLASLSRIYCDNVNGIVSMNRDAFKLGQRISCQNTVEIPGINFCFWKDCSQGSLPQFNNGTKKCTCEPIECPGNQVPIFDQFTKIFSKCACPAALSKFDKASQQCVRPVIPTYSRRRRGTSWRRQRRYSWSG